MDGGLDALLVEDARAQGLEDEPDAAVGALDGGRHALHAPRDVRVAGDRAEGLHLQAHGGELLPEVVVELAREAPPLGLEHFIEARGEASEVARLDLDAVLEQGVALGERGAPPVDLPLELEGPAEELVEGVSGEDAEGRGHDEEADGVGDVGLGERAVEAEGEARQGGEHEQRRVEEPLGEAHHHHAAHDRGHVERGEPVAVVARELAHRRPEHPAGEERRGLEQARAAPPVRHEAVEHEVAPEDREEGDPHRREGLRGVRVVPREGEVVGGERHRHGGPREAHGPREGLALGVGDDVEVVGGWGRLRGHSGAHRGISAGG